MTREIEVTNLNCLPVVGAVVAGFLVSAVWYMVFGSRVAALSSATPNLAPWVVPVSELVRNLVVALVLAGLVARIGIERWTGATLLGLALWIAFPAVLLFGSVIHENVPTALAAIHAGDWLLKLIVMAVIVGQWR